MEDTYAIPYYVRTCAYYVEFLHDLKGDMLYVARMTKDFGLETKYTNVFFWQKYSYSNSSGTVLLH